MEESPQCAGIAAIRGFTTETAILGIAFRVLFKRFVLSQELLHLDHGLIVGQIVRHGLGISRMIGPGLQRDEIISQLWSQVGQKVDDSLEVEAESPKLFLVHIFGCDLIIDAATDGNLEVRLVDLEETL